MKTAWPSDHAVFLLEELVELEILVALGILEVLVVLIVIEDCYFTIAPKALYALPLRTITN